MFLFKVNSSKRRAECRVFSSRVNSLRSTEEGGRRAAQLIVVIPALGTVFPSKLISIAIFRDIFNVALPLIESFRKELSGELYCGALMHAFLNYFPVILSIAAWEEMFFYEGRGDICSMFYGYDAMQADLCRWRKKTRKRGRASSKKSVQT